MRVPSWRTKIFPARTVSPPKTFTPRRCPWLSRPLRELPPAFLCAIAYSPTLRFDCRNLECGLVLPVALLPAVAFSPFFLEDADFFGSDLADNLAAHFGICHERSADFGLAVSADE